MVQPELKTGDYVFRNEMLPAVSASASTDDRGVTHISLVNIDAAKTQDVTIDVRGAKFTALTGRILTAEKIQDYNSFEQPSKIKPGVFKEATLSGNTLKLKLPAHSVVVLEAK